MKGNCSKAIHFLRKNIWKEWIGHLAKSSYQWIWLASEEWHLLIDKIIELFKRVDVFGNVGDKEADDFCIKQLFVPFLYQYLKIENDKIKRNILLGRLFLF